MTPPPSPSKITGHDLTQLDSLIDENMNLPRAKRARVEIAAGLSVFKEDQLATFPGIFYKFPDQAFDVLPSAFGQNRASPYFISFVPEFAKTRQIILQQLRDKPTRYLKELVTDLVTEKLFALLGTQILQNNEALVLRGQVPDDSLYWSWIPYLAQRHDVMRLNSIGQPRSNLLLKSLQPSVTKHPIWTFVVTSNPAIWSRIQKAWPFYSDQLVVIPVGPPYYQAATDSLMLLMRWVTLNTQSPEPFFGVTGCRFHKITQENWSPANLGAPSPEIPISYPDSTSSKQTSLLQQATRWFNKTGEAQIQRLDILNLAQAVSDRTVQTYTSGNACTLQNLNCLADNADTAYLISSPACLGPKDVMVIVSVNHSKFGNAVYNTINLYDVPRQYSVWASSIVRSNWTVAKDQQPSFQVTFVSRDSDSLASFLAIQKQQQQVGWSDVGWFTVAISADTVAFSHPVAVAERAYVNPRSISESVPVLNRATRPREDLLVPMQIAVVKFTA